MLFAVLAVLVVWLLLWVWIYFAFVHGDEWMMFARETAQWTATDNSNHNHHSNNHHRHSTRR